MVGGVVGGRSTYGLCHGVLVWRVDEGTVGDVDVAGLLTALIAEYDDDEPGSPWTVLLHVDDRAAEEQHEALAQVFLGGAGGEHLSRLPWIRKARRLVGVRSSPMELVPDGDGYRLAVGDVVRLRATTRVPTEAPVACGIPGYDRVGFELYADELVVEEEKFSWSLTGNCAYESDFDYVG
jgi:hypothetical protein